MSIVALKRKTDAKYKNLSTNQKNGFSLNGTTRQQGYIGQTSLSRHLSFTPMKGTTVKGHGGCCGTYTHAPVIKSASLLCLDDNTIVKGSVLNTKGMLKERYNCDLCNVVKPTIKSNSDFIKKKAKKAMECDTSEYRTSCCINTNLKISTLSRHNYAKPDSAYTSISSGEYLNKLTKSCVDNDPNVLPVNVKRSPFGSSL